MANAGALKWDQVGEKKYEMGVSKGVLYKKDKTTGKWLGVAWNGLTSVSASPDGGDANDQYADNIKYGSIRGAESYGGSIEAFTSPKEFDSCDGTRSLEGIPGITVGQQPREMFRLCYRSEQGNDELGQEYGYKLHLIYGCTCSPTERTHETINDNPDMETLSWDFDSTPIDVTGYKPTSEITIDSTLFKTEADKAILKEIEDLLYGVDANTEAGTAATVAELPDPDDLFALIGA